MLSENLSALAEIRRDEIKTQNMKTDYLGNITQRKMKIRFF